MSSQRARVELRSPAPDDRDEFLAAMRASRKLHRPWLQSPITDEAYDQLLVRAEDERFDPQLVCLRGGGAIVGYMNISQIVRGPFQSGFLGYGAVAEYAGHGYMSEGLQLVLARAFTELGLHRIEANIQPGNTASIALVENAGFVNEGFAERYLKVGGRWRDHEHWAIRAEQWRERNRRRNR
jgi:[ribosomal protein S5]-alanine N-acetyltransferase